MSEEREKEVAVACMTCLVNQSGCCSTPWPCGEAEGCPGAAHFERRQP